MIVFEGFQESNTTPVPDVLFDALLSELSGAELKVLLYIIRRTRGFKKDTDAISLSQFQKGIITRDKRILDRGCGISDRQTIVNALESLETKHCIECVKAKTSSGDNDVTRYRIYFAKPTGNPDPQGGEEGGREIQPPVNGKTPQGVVGKSNHPTNIKGGRKNQPQVVGKPNRGSAANPTGVVGKPNPQETEFQQTVSQQTDDKNECAAPTPSLVDNSSNQSPDLNLNLEERGAQPSPPDPDLQSASGLRIAPASNESMPAMPDMPVSPPQGYKTDDRPDAVMENSTEIDESIESIDRLRFWLKHLGVHGSKDPIKKNADLEKILPRVGSKAALESLIAWSSAVLFARYGEHRQVFVGNLADQVEAWAASKPPGQAPSGSESKDNAPMGQVGAETFARSLLSLYPTELLGTMQPYPDEDIWLMALRYGSGEKDWVYFENAEHYYNPSPWELECIIDARIWAKQIMQSSIMAS